VENNFKFAKAIPYVNKEQAMNDLINGKIEAFICDSPEIWWLSGEYEEQGLIPVPVVLDVESLGWGIRKEDTKLLTKVNKSLASWKKSKKSDKRILYWLPYIELFFNEENRPELY